MKEFFSVLRSSQLFGGISETELRAILSCLDTKTENYPKDAFVLRPGDTVEAVGLVLEGSVLVIQEDVWGNRNILSTAGPGQTFAAAFACAPGARLNVSVMAEAPVIVIFLDVARILNVCPSACAHHSRIIRNLLGELAEKICASVKSSPTWASAPHGISSCPISRQRRSAGESTNLTYPFPDSSWQITWGWSAAAFLWSWGKCAAMGCWIFTKAILFCMCSSCLPFLDIPAGILYNSKMLSLRSTSGLA